jgi:serine/threonine-protein kinase RsbT
MENETSVAISSAADIVVARQKGRQLAMEVGFGGSELTLIATAISEIARNIVDHAEKGQVILSPTNHGNRRGIQVIAKDKGPGIPDVERAMQYGFTTNRGLGVGLPGAKSLMDEFKVETKVGKGTTITMRKWVNNGR